MTINIGNPRMTRELLEGDPHMQVYVGCNVNTRVWYTYGTRVAMQIVVYATQHLENIYIKLV